MRFNKLTYRLLSAAVAVLAAIALPACSDTPETPAKNDDNVYMRFVIAAGDGTRSRSIGVWEEADADDAERLMRISETRIYLFDAVTNTLITTMRPSDLPWSDSNDGYYTITASFPIDKLENFSDYQNNSSTIRMKIAIVANMNSCGSEFPQVSEGMSYDNLEPTFTMVNDYFPTVAGEKGIPMYGVNSYTVNLAALENSVEFAPVSIAPVRMLRALCKVELSDKLTNTYVGSDGITYPHVNSVTMTSWNQSGRVRFNPANDVNYYENNRITSARIVESPASLPKSCPKVNDKTWRVYLPEGHMSSAVMTVNVTRGPGMTPEDFVYEFKNADKFGTGDLIRNHIYRLDLTAVGATAELTVGVKPWVTVSEDIEYTETVSVNNYPTWRLPEVNDDFGVDAGDLTQGPTLHIYNGTEAYIPCDFEISSPRGATWSAQLVPGQNGVDAFEFVNIENGYITGTSQVVTGTVGEPATIYLRGKGAAPLIDGYAELVIVIRNADGTALYAPIDNNQNTRYRLIRHKPMS